MTMSALHRLTHKRIRHAYNDNRRMKKKNPIQVIQDKQMPGILSTLLTIFCLIAVFTILAYFRPH